MRNLLILLLVIVLSACSSVQQKQAILPAATSQPTTCKVYALKSVLQHDGSYNENGSGSFAQINASDGGTTIWVYLPLSFINKMLSINGAGSGDIFTYQKMYEGKNGTIYGNYFRMVVGQDPYATIAWNWVAAPSPDQAYHPGVYNYVCVSKIENGYAYIVAAPKSVDYNWTDGIDWLHWLVVANWRGTPTLWNMIPVDPSSGFELSGRTNKEFKIKVDWLAFYVRTDNIPQQILNPSLSITATPTPTFTATFTPTPTQTQTPEPTPTPQVYNFVCFKSTWALELHERPSASMYNIPLGVSVDPGGIVPAEAVITNLEGAFAQVNAKVYFAIHLNSNGRDYAVKTACP